MIGRWPLALQSMAKMVTTVATFLAAAFLILYSAAQFDSAPPMHFLSSDKHVISAADGRSFFVTRETCLDRNVPGEGLPRLIGVGSNVLIPLPPKPLSAMLGCHNYSVLVLIPEEVPPGEYEYRITYRFQMNPFKTLDVPALPVRVTVTQ